VGEVKILVACEYSGRVRSLRFHPGCEQYDYCGEGGED